MARTSSSRRSNAFSGLAALLLLGAVALGLAGCGNDNPASRGGTMTVDLRGIKSQLGNGFSTQTTGPGESDATTDVKSLIIGAVVITFTGTALNESTPIDSGIEDKLASDLINSINFFSIVDLPTSDDFVEFKVPPPSAGDWQVAAIGTKKRITTFQDLDDANVAIYYGFDPQFHSTSSGSQPDVSITMNRACFIDAPPLGCAQILDNTKSVVTGSVEIIDVRNADNDTLIAGGDFSGAPIVVRNASQAASAMTTLNALNVAGVSKVKVRATHQLAPVTSAGCKAATGAGIISACADEIGEFTTKL